MRELIEEIKIQCNRQDDMSSIILYDIRQIIKKYEEKDMVPVLIQPGEVLMCNKAYGGLIKKSICDMDISIIKEEHNVEKTDESTDRPNYE